MKKSIALCFVLICLAGLYVACASNVKGQSTNIYISADGSVVGTNNIQRNGDSYVLTANISGGILFKEVTSSLIVQATHLKDMAGQE